MPNASNIGRFVALGNFDPENPAKCFQDQGLPVPIAFPSAAEVKEEAKGRAMRILSAYETLRQILDRHESQIRKRWLKKTKGQQKAILLSAWPNMAPAHRPDFEAFKREGIKKREREGGVTKFRDWYLWPIINLQDLTLKRSLLHLLHSRGRNSPSSFARADLNRTGLGQSTRAIKLPFIHKYSMFLDDSTATYGEICSWDDRAETYDMLISGRAFDPPRDLLTLEIQERIMSFLVKCCENVLHDMGDIGSLLGPAYPVKETLSPITTDASNYPTTVGLAVERQYRAPIDFDFRRIQVLVEAKRAEAEDHIYALREDPGYFAETITEWSEHRREHIFDTDGKEHLVGPNSSQNYALFWELVSRHTIQDAYEALIDWYILDRQLKHLESLEEEYTCEIPPLNRLPPEYLHALLTFKQMLTVAQARPTVNLANYAPASPPLRSLYLRQPQNSLALMPTSARIGSLVYVLEKLYDPLVVQRYGLPDLLDQLEHLSLTQPSRKSQLSRWVSHVISDLGLLAQLQDELESYQPWAAGLNYQLAQVHDKLKKEVLNRFSISQVIDNNMEFVSTGLAPLGAPVYNGERRFYYPSDKRRTRETTEAMRLAEEKLDQFWTTIDGKYKSKVGKSIDELAEGFLSEKRDLQRTPEWVEPNPKPKKAGPKSVQAVDDSFSTLGLSSTGSISQEKSTMPKPKIKTKGVAGTSEATATQPGQPSQADIQPILPVDRRAHKVFKTLFFTPNLTDLPGEIPLVDFLHALASTGFQPQKLYASVWQFTPTNLDVERSINFHEPHPHNKIPFQIARRMGRRLNRAYGWHSAMFVLG